MLISLFSTLTFVSLSQYPSWMPNEFKNKVFCGEFDCSGKMIGGTTSFNTVPYELIISEEGIQVSINPGAKFRRNEWGKTIKIKYKTKEIWQSKEFSFWKKYELDLSSANETNDSPLHPEYRLNRITISVSNYNNQILTRDQQRSFNAYPIDKSWIEFDVSVPYYGTGGPGKGTWANASICRSIKTQGEILKDKNKYPSIDILINEKKFKEAYVLVNKLYSPSNYPKATLIKNALLDSDKSLNNTINEYAKNGDYVKAFQSFDLLNFKEQYTFNLDDWRTIQEDLLIAEYKKRRVNSLSSLVKNYLIDKYKDYSEELPIEKINQLIKDNKINLSKLNSGSYDLKITNTGKILIDNKDVSKEFSYTKSIKIFHDEFDIYINEYSKLIIKDSLEKFKNSGATGNLTLVEYKLNPKHQNTSVYFKKNENKELNFYCDKSMLVETLKKSRKDLNYIGGDGNKITYDSRISKKSIKYSVIENKVKYVNGIIVDKIPGLYNWIDKELIIKRHIVKKITIAALFGGLMYLTSNY
jgi:hypothetical protein